MRPQTLHPPADAAPEGPRTLADLLRSRREERGLTLGALARRVGCAKSYLWLIERGGTDARPAPRPGDDFLRKLASALDLDPCDVARAADWGAVPAAVRDEIAQIHTRADGERRLARMLTSGWRGRGISLDEAYRSGELRRLVEMIDPDPAEPPRSPPPAALPARGPAPRPVAAALPMRVPLINKVAAGYPTEFTDLGYPVAVADEYVRCGELDDPDAFAARIVGDSMAPQYAEGDIVVFSPARAVRDGSDCFVRLEPDHETTFKRVRFERSNDGAELIRLEPLNPAYPARVVERERVAGLYAAVSVTRAVG